MNARTPQPRSRFSVANAVTAIVAAWFVVGMGSIAAEAGQPVVAAPAKAQPGSVTLTADGRMKLTVVAPRLPSP